MFKCTGRNKQTAHGCESRSSDRGQSPGVQPLPASLGCQVNSDSCVRRPFPGQIGCCLRRELALPFRPLHGHCPHPLWAGPPSQGFDPRPRLSVRHLMITTTCLLVPCIAPWNPIILTCVLPCDPSLLLCIMPGSRNHTDLPNKKWKGWKSIALGLSRADGWVPREATASSSRCQSFFSVYLSVLGVWYYIRFRCTINLCLYGRSITK